jgi:LEA14-like dessication related protein
VAQGGAKREKVSSVKLVRLLTGVFVVGALGSACGRPKPPTLTPEKGEVTSVGPDGIHLVLHLAVDNPNRFDLSARSVTGHVKLDGQHDLGAVTVSQPFRLPAEKSTPLAVPVTVAFKDLPLVIGLAASNRNLNFDVDGSVNVGGESLNMDLPFQLHGVVTHEQLLKATVNSLPRFP